MMVIVDEIRNELKQIDEKDVYIFIFSLLSRQKNTFDQIAEANQWDGSEIITEVYSCVKENLYDSTSSIYECIVTRTDIEYLMWEAQEEDMQIANTFLDNLFAFVNQLQDRSNLDYAFSQCNFDLLESRIINELGWENVNEDVLLSNDNVQLEYAREKRDLELIKSGRFDIDACSETLV
jgi:hypothetical protein